MNLIYIAYAREEVRRNALFSILTFLHYQPILNEPTKIILYTDKPSAFAPVKDHVKFRKVSEKKLRKWQKGTDLVPLARMGIIRDAAESLKGSLFYIDADTWFRKAPYTMFNAIQPGHTFLHSKECKVSDRPNRSMDKTYKALKKQNKFEIKGEKEKLSKHMDFYHSGVIGLHAADLGYAERAFKLCRELYEEHPLHTMEHVAWSHLLQTRTEVREAEPWVYHAWGQGHLMGPVLEKFFKRHSHKSVELMAEEAAKLQPTFQERGKGSSFWRRLFQG